MENAVKVDDLMKEEDKPEAKRGRTAKAAPAVPPKVKDSMIMAGVMANMNAEAAINREERALYAGIAATILAGMAPTCPSAEKLAARVKLAIQAGDLVKAEADAYGTRGLVKGRE